MSMDIEQHSPPNSPTLQRTKSRKRKLKVSPLPLKKRKLEQFQPDPPLPNGSPQIKDERPSTATLSWPSDEPRDSSAEDLNSSQFLNAYEATHPTPTNLSRSAREPASPFFLKRASLYVAIPPLSLRKKNGLRSLITLHLAPLLFTYYRPFSGVVISFRDVSISEEPDPEVEGRSSLSTCLEETGVSLAWLTATFLVLSPQRGDLLYGTLAVNSGDFIGLLLYSYFPVAISGDRIPKSWTWIKPPDNQPSNKSLRSRSTSLESSSSSETGSNGGDENATSSSDGDETALSSDATLRGSPNPSPSPSPSSTSPSSSSSSSSSSFTAVIKSKGYFTYPSLSGPIPIPQNLPFRVVDTNVGLSAGKWSLQIEGSFLSDEEESKAVEEDRKRWEWMEALRKAQTQERRGEEEARAWLMTGGLREDEMTKRSETPGKSSSRRGSMNNEWTDGLQDLEMNSI